MNIDLDLCIDVMFILFAFIFNCYKFILFILFFWAIVKKVENSKTDTLFFGRGGIRPNFILDVKADN